VTQKFAGAFRVAFFLIFIKLQQIFQFGIAFVMRVWRKQKLQRKEVTGMWLTKWREPRTELDRPLVELDRFFDEMWSDRFDDFFRVPSLLDWVDRTLTSWQPALDVEETDDAFLVHMDLPGMNKKDIHVTVDDNVLTIRGERKREEEKKDANYYCSERFYGTFQRSFTLPSQVNADQIKADYKNGVLHITLPKKEEARARKIEIR